MKFCDGRFEVETDAYNWILHEHYIGESKKTREPVPAIKSTYYTEFGHLLEAILERCCKKCETIEELKNLLINAKQIIKQDNAEPTKNI